MIVKVLWLALIIAVLGAGCSGNSDVPSTPTLQIAGNSQEPFTPENPPPVADSSTAPATGVAPIETVQVAAAPSPVPPSGRIAWVNAGNIWVMDEDGSNKRQLTTDGTALTPVWSPDGARIAFASGSGMERDIFVINADGSGLRNLSNVPGDERSPTWAPDGSRVAFERFYIQTQPFLEESGIYVVNANGSGLARLADSDGTDTAPAWSPTGQEFAFIRAKAIWLMNIDGTGRRQVGPATLPSTLSVAWSPVGSKVAFSSVPPMSIQGLQDIYVLDVASGKVTKLTETEDNSSPAWSSDGTKIAFTSWRGGNQDLFVMNADGSGQLRLTDDPGADAQPNWGER